MICHKHTIFRSSRSTVMREPPRRPSRSDIGARWGPTHTLDTPHGGHGHGPDTIRCSLARRVYLTHLTEGNNNTQRAVKVISVNERCSLQYARYIYCVCVVPPCATAIQSSLPPQNAQAPRTMTPKPHQLHKSPHTATAFSSEAFQRVALSSPLLAASIAIPINLRADS